MSEEEQIRKLKEIGLGSILTDIKIRTIDTLAVYGEKAIPAIAEIADHSIVTEVKEYALDTVRRIKERGFRPPL